MKQKYFIDSQKALTPVFILLLMALYNQWMNQTAWIYLALHGTYGILWLIKSRIFPDKAFDQETSLAYGLVIWGGLSLYWVAPWLLITRHVQAPAWFTACCISLYSFGVFTHFSADMQKYVALQLKPGQLISDGFFQRTRNVNYFGELLIYSGFGLLAMHWLPIIIILVWVVFVWLPRMRLKDRSLSRYADFDKYRHRTRLFIPYIY